MPARLLLLGCAAICTLAGASAGTAASPGANGRLVFTQWLQQVHRFETPRAFLCSSDPDGAGQSRLGEAHPRRDGHVAFRPQGDRLAFTRGASTMTGELWTAAADGSDARRLGDVTGSSPAWTAAGDAVLLGIGGDIWSLAWPDGAAAPLVATGAHEGDPAASPDGTRIAFVRGGQLVVRRLADAAETPVAPGLLASQPDWSPDSRRIVFATSAGDLHVVAPDSTGLTRLGPGGAPAFSPDGTRIAFTREGDVWTMRADGSDAVRVTLSPVLELEPAWQPLPLPQTPPAAGTAPCVLVGTDGDDVLVGSEGPDVFYDLAGDDVIRGLGGDDVVWDGHGNDRIDTGDGNDVVKLGEGNNVVPLGAGTDRVDATSGADGTNTIDGGDGNDVLNGGTGADRILGGTGNDVVSGNRGPDVLFGGPGDDDLTGNRGDDYLDGGLGDDVLLGGRVSGAPQTYDGYDILLGRGGDDLLVGGWQKDRLFGGPGRDRLAGGGHADRLDGGPGPDLFLGGAGDDLLLARDGEPDALRGGTGFDRATADARDVLRGVERRLR